MKLKDILTQDCTFCSVAVTSKKRILEKICMVAASKIDGYSHQELLESLMARENMGSTGIGNGIAIPHGRLTGHKQAIAILLTSESPIKFDAIDNRAVDIFIALFVSEDSCQEHLSTLQSIAMMFADKKTSKLVRKCKDNFQLFQLIQQES